NLLPVILHTHNHPTVLGCSIYRCIVLFSICKFPGRVTVINDQLKRWIFYTLAILQHSNIAGATLIAAREYGTTPNSPLNTDRLSFLIIEQIKFRFSKNKPIAIIIPVFESATNYLLFRNTV